MNILALDVATKTGWASPTASGVWDLKVKRDESGGMRLVRFKSKLKEILESEQIDLVVFERSSGFHKNALITQAEMHGVLKNTLDEIGIPYRAYSSGEIKKQATGKGNAKKPQMIAAAVEKWPDIIIEDDNHADALWLKDLAEKDINNV